MEIKNKPWMCMICNLSIDKNKSYCELSEFFKEKRLRQKSKYHIECFSNRLSGSQQLRGLQNAAAKLILGASKKLDIPLDN